MHDLLKYNQGKGFYSFDGFPEGPGFRGDASKSRSGARGGWVCADGYYDFYRYGGAASRKPIDFLEGDTVLRCCADNAHRWSGLQIPAGIDNSAFELSAEAGRSRAPRLNDVLRGTFVLQLQYNFILLPYWLCSEDNYLADDLSRDRESSFLSRAYDFVLPHCSLIRHPEAGRVVTSADNDYVDAMKALRQLLKSYKSNYTGDGPVRGAGVGGDAQLLSIQYPYTTIFDGCPAELVDRLDEVMDNRLRPGSMRKVVTGFSRWCAFADSRGWDRVMASGLSSRGGRLSSWILSMLDDTDLVYHSISTYVWGMRTMHTLQHQSDPAMGVVFCFFVSLCAPLRCFRRYRVSPVSVWSSRWCVPFFLASWNTPGRTVCAFNLVWLFSPCFSPFLARNARARRILRVMSRGTPANIGKLAISRFV